MKEMFILWMFFILIILAILIYEYYKPNNNLTKKDILKILPYFISNGERLLQIKSLYTGKYLIIKDDKLYANGSVNDPTSLWTFNSNNTLLNQITTTTLNGIINEKEIVYVTGPLVNYDYYNIILGSDNIFQLTPNLFDNLAITVASDGFCFFNFFNNQQILSNQSFQFYLIK